MNENMMSDKNKRKLWGTENFLNNQQYVWIKNKNYELQENERVVFWMQNNVYAST